MGIENWSTATAVLRLAAELVEDIQRGVVAAGFDDVRPAHGFAFALLSAGPATTSQLAEHLGITKQATSELVQHLIEAGYLTREPDPHDRRARLLVLTDRGRSCTQAAQDAANRAVGGWERRIPTDQVHVLHEVLAAATTPGPLRPAW